MIVSAATDKAVALNATIGLAQSGGCVTSPWLLGETMASSDKSRPTTFVISTRSTQPPASSKIAAVPMVIAMFCQVIEITPISGS